MKNVITLGILFTATIFIVSCGDSTEGVKSTAGGKSPKESIANHGDDSAEIILVAYDWVYPDMDNPMGALKFSSDGTFRYSTTAFDGMTRTGTWKDVGDSKVELDYDDGGTGELEITSSTTFKVGSTTYNRY